MDYLAMSSKIAGNLTLLGAASNIILNFGRF
jgi:Na+/H+ antiporter NhaD/arsenite permease-like protein